MSGRSKQPWSTPTRTELAARATRGGASPGPIEFVGYGNSCYPGGGGTTPTGPVGS